MDHLVMSGRGRDREYGDGVKEWLKELKNVAKETNEEWAEYLGIPKSKQLTLVKPSGTVSQLCGTSSGIHPRHSPFYIRRVTQDRKDPLTDLMIDQGIPYTIVGEKAIFSFPIASPQGAVCVKDMDSISQLELWKVYREHWCDGNPSQTIYYTDDSFLEVQAWVYKNWDIVGGLSFFPKDDNIYENAPYEEVDEGVYLEAVKNFNVDIDWTLLPEYEIEDSTQRETEFACSGGNCEI